MKLKKVNLDDVGAVWTAIVVGMIVVVLIVSAPELAIVVVGLMILFGTPWAFTTVWNKFVKWKTGDTD